MARYTTTTYTDYWILYIKMQHAVTGGCKYICVLTLNLSIANEVAIQLTEIWKSGTLCVIVNSRSRLYACLRLRSNKELCVQPSNIACLKHPMCHADRHKHHRIKQVLHHAAGPVH